MLFMLTKCLMCLVNRNEMIKKTVINCLKSTSALLLPINDRYFISNADAHCERKEVF